MKSPKKHSLSSPETRTSLSSFIKHFVIVLISAAVIQSLYHHIQYKSKIDEIKQPAVKTINKHLKKQETIEQKLLQNLEARMLNRKRWSSDFGDEITGFFFGIRLSGKSKADQEKMIMKRFKRTVISEKMIAKFVESFKAQYINQMMETQNQLALELESVFVNDISLQQKEALKRALKKEFDRQAHLLGVRGVNASVNGMVLFASSMLLSSVIVTALSGAIRTTMIGTTSMSLSVSTLGLSLVVGGLLDGLFDLFDDSDDKLASASRLAVNTISKQVIKHVKKEIKNHRSDLEDKLDDIIEEVAAQKLDRLDQHSKL